MTNIGAQTWEWILFGMPWQWAAGFAVLGVIGLIGNEIGKGK